MNLLHRLLAAALAAFFIAGPALAQIPGEVTSHAFLIGKGPGVTGYTSLLCGSAQLAVGQAAADPICQTITGDVTITAGGVTAIGATKVTNAMLATMAANTTKCNATAGVAVPTDCSAATMRTNIGVVIGTNVQAWDTDLDCLAGISTTGFIKRTGGGTCSAGSFALADLPTGTQDTILGYFGTTAASALAINNCANALTYSTTTHTFGCNSSAGTGTVTSVTCFGVAITTTGTCTTTGQLPGIASNTAATSGNVGEIISSTVTQAAPLTGFVNATAKDITSISLTAGDWEVWGNVGSNPSAVQTSYLGWVSTTSATLPAFELTTFFAVSSQSGIGFNLPAPTLRILVNATTTVYLSGQFNFASGTMSGYGRLYARRVR
jgi:hypothetical protein